MKVFNPAAVAAVAVVLLSAGAFAGDVVRTPRVVSERTVDCYDVNTIIAGITRPDMTPRQKAEAVYEFVRQHRWHWAPAREGPQRDNYEYGIVYDPVKLLNVYGYGYCFQTAPLLESLYQSAGLEARNCGIGGHSICEVYYDGQYHFYDADQHGFCRLLDGQTVASMEQLSRDPIRLVLNQPKPSEPFFPATKNPRVPYESKVIVAAYFASRQNNHVRHDKTDIGHRMDISLAPGMRLTRYFQPKGAWSYNYKDIEGDLKNGYLDAQTGPSDPITGKTYGNGSLLWQPDLCKDSNEYRAGVWQDENIAQDEHGLFVDRPNVVGRAVFRVRVPYVIVGWPGSWTEDKPVGAAVVSARFVPGAAGETEAISVSTDGGRTWTRAWETANAEPVDAVVDLSSYVAGRYEYLVRIEMASRPLPPEATGSCRLERLSILTNFQLNPAVLPAVGEGETKMKFCLGEQTETTELVADLSSGEGFLRDVAELRDINFRPGRLMSRGGRPGEIVYELAPPQLGQIRSFSVVAGCRREPGEFTHLDDIKLHYAENEPRNWKLLADDDVPDYAQHWSYFMPASAQCSQNVRRVFVKLAIRSARSASVQMIKFRLNWQPAREAPGRRGLAIDQGMPLRGVRIEHGWTEAGVAKSFETVVNDAPSEYVVKAGRNVVNNCIVIEPVRIESVKWRLDDPAFQPPKLTKPQLVDPRLRDEMQGLCRSIDQDQAKFLPQASASKIEWLAGGAREAIAMFKTTYPLPEPQFGLATLRRARALLSSAAGSQPATAPADEAETILVRLQATRDISQRATLAAAVVLLGDSRGEAPLADAIGKAPAAANVEPAALLLRSGHATGRAIAAKILGGQDTYLKLAYLDALLLAKPKTIPDELLVGLTDASRWVRLATLQLCRGQNSAVVRRALTRMVKDDPLPFLRDEAASMLTGQ